MKFFVGRIAHQCRFGELGHENCKCKFRARFSSKLKNAWDDFFHEHPRLIVFACGSVSAWIKKNILGNKGFAGRTSLDVVVPELPFGRDQVWGLSFFEA